MKTQIKLAGLLGAVCLLTGCAAGILVGGLAVGAAAGAGAIAYSKGELRATENMSMDQAWTATQAAMKDLQFTVVEQNHDSLNGKVSAQDTTKKKILVQMHKSSANQTEIRIRVGTFGDEAVSRSILDAIRKQAGVAHSG